MVWVSIPTVLTLPPLPAAFPSAPGTLAPQGQRLASPRPRKVSESGLQLSCSLDLSDCSRLCVSCPLRHRPVTALGSPVSGPVFFFSFFFSVLSCELTLKGKLADSMITLTQRRQVTWSLGPFPSQSSRRKGLKLGLTRMGQFLRFFSIPVPYTPHSGQ